MQKMAKAQFMLGLLPQIQATGGDPKEVMRRVLEAVDTEDIDKISRRSLRPIRCCSRCRWRT
jgi:hypothetical protein